MIILKKYFKVYLIFIKNILSTIFTYLLKKYAIQKINIYIKIFECKKT